MKGELKVFGLTVSVQLGVKTERNQRMEANRFRYCGEIFETLVILARGYEDKRDQILGNPSRDNEDELLAVKRCLKDVAEDSAMAHSWLFYS